jgi:manganese oxidase
MPARTSPRPRPLPAATALLLLAALLAALGAAPPAAAQLSEPTGICNRTLVADVVALDQVFFWNRLGAVQPQGMIYALRRNVVSSDHASELLQPGKVMLREDLRPRPLVLRMNVGDCLRIEFENLLAPQPADQQQPHTREASVHAEGLELVAAITDDGTHVGTNPPAQVGPGGHAVYTYYARHEGEHVIHSGGAMTGGEGDGGSTNAGLFGAINVEPPGSRWYRSQVTRDDLRLAARTETAEGPVLDDSEVRWTLAGQPKVDFERTYPDWHPKADLPILAMLRGNEIVHSDLTAIVAGIPQGHYPPIGVAPDRNRPFREITVIYHDEIGAVQAFPIFEDETFAHTLHSGRDAFAINYGTGGIGAEILANRFGVGVMHDCTTCKYEEFFLSSWTVGDPAQVVDVPANAPCTIEDVRLEAESDNGDAITCTPEPGPKATKVFYPDDPSNVYHSYHRDHLRFRTLHAGTKEHHIHHLHAHQWLYSPDGDNSTYLDSQALGPGSSFTMEIAYHGSGNRNVTVGDSIFHCHFYPHFAQGMWALWRVHDVFEEGTRLDDDGRPAIGARALPDGEIPRGTPIPAVVPLPGQPMAPPPGAAVRIVDGQVVLPDPITGNPGFPFFIPGIAGERAPHPPKDFAERPDGSLDDGGLPRHIVSRDDERFVEVHTRLDFTKILEAIDARQLAEEGEPVERVAMEFHAQREHPTCTPEGLCDEQIGGSGEVSFVANGRPPVPGAPYADPCVRTNGEPDLDTFRTFKAADIQLDVALNKDGWHFPQQRMVALWEDVESYLDGVRPPEPLFFRANSNDCIEYHLTNLVPGFYELDDFQVRTPTDILGQHIHLVKFDVTSSDGAANGWNYEDGTFSPDEVRERIHAINELGGLLNLEGEREILTARTHHKFNDHADWVGAQTTVQRWYADDVLNVVKHDRTLRTVFTHDHFSPSTHQQAGLYAGLVVEPTGSTWFHPITGDRLGHGRDDGGPTLWKADIHTNGDIDGDGKDDSYREFLLEFQDFQHAYEMESHPELEFARGPVFDLRWEEARAPGEGYDRPPFSINPPAKEEAGLPFLLEKRDDCPGDKPLPCPELISAADVGTMSVNYRNEPVALRVRDPEDNDQADGDAGDLALAFSSLVDRADDDFDVQPGFYQTPLNPHAAPRDPFTPLMEAFEHDQVQIRILVGAHEEGHNFAVNGIKWRFEPSEGDSGYRNSQIMGISEHFEFVIPQMVKNTLRDKVDYLWSAGTSSDDLWNGLWGLMRVYRSNAVDLERLPNNPLGGHDILESELSRFDGVCLKEAPKEPYDVVAALARDILPERTLIYNRRPGKRGEGPLHDPTAILYVRADDLDPETGMLPDEWRREPLVLRANAGDCIEITLENRLPRETPLPDLDGFSTLPMIVERFNFNQIHPSKRVGLHPQLLHYDVSRADGNDVGLNLLETVPPGKSAKYQWYAADVYVEPSGKVKVTPIEFGATNLIPADRIKQPSKGLIGGLIVEPLNATWAEDRGTHASADLEWTDPDNPSLVPLVAREHVLFFQNDLNLRFGGPVSSEEQPISDGGPIPNLAGTEDPEDSGQKAFSYRTEPVWFRMGFPPETPLEQTRTFQLADVFSNGEVGGDPETPIFTAERGDAVRFRLLHPGGTQRNHVFHLHGHVWQQTPYTSLDGDPIDPPEEIGSTKLGTSEYSYWEGARMGIGPTCHDDALVPSAGGAMRIGGDYMYRDFVTFHLDGGLWGIFRVGPQSTVEEVSSP